MKLGTEGMGLTPRCTNLLVEPLAMAQDLGPVDVYGIKEGAEWIPPASGQLLRLAGGEGVRGL